MGLNVSQEGQVIRLLKEAEETKKDVLVETMAWAKATKHTMVAFPLPDDEVEDGLDFLFAGHTGFFSPRLYRTVKVGDAGDDMRLCSLNFVTVACDSDAYVDWCLPVITPQSLAFFASQTDRVKHVKKREEQKGEAKEQKGKKKKGKRETVIEEEPRLGLTEWRALHRTKPKGLIPPDTSALTQLIFYLWSYAAKKKSQEGKQLSGYTRDNSVAGQQYTAQLRLQESMKRILRWHEESGQIVRRRADELSDAWDEKAPQPLDQKELEAKIAVEDRQIAQAKEEAMAANDALELAKQAKNKALDAMMQRDAKSEIKALAQARQDRDALDEKQVRPAIETFKTALGQLADVEKDIDQKESAMNFLTQKEKKEFTDQIAALKLKLPQLQKARKQTEQHKIKLKEQLREQNKKVEELQIALDLLRAFSEDDPTLDAFNKNIKTHTTALTVARKKEADAHERKRQLQEEDRAVKQALAAAAKRKRKEDDLERFKKTPLQHFEMMYLWTEEWLYNHREQLPLLRQTLVKPELDSKHEVWRRHQPAARVPSAHLNFRLVPGPSRFYALSELASFFPVCFDSVRAGRMLQHLVQSQRSQVVRQYLYREMKRTKQKRHELSVKLQAESKVQSDETSSWSIEKLEWELGKREQHSPSPPVFAEGFVPFLAQERTAAATERARRPKQLHTYESLWDTQGAPLEPVEPEQEAARQPEVSFQFYFFSDQSELRQSVEVPVMLRIEPLRVILPEEGAYQFPIGANAGLHPYVAPKTRQYLEVLRRIVPMIPRMLVHERANIELWCHIQEATRRSQGAWLPTSFSHCFLDIYDWWSCDETRFLELCPFFQHLVAQISPRSMAELGRPWYGDKERKGKKKKDREDQKRRLVPQEAKVEDPVRQRIQDQRQDYVVAGMFVDQLWHVIAQRPPEVTPQTLAVSDIEYIEDNSRSTFFGAAKVLSGLCGYGTKGNVYKSVVTMIHGLQGGAKFKPHIQTFLHRLTEMLSCRYLYVMSQPPNGYNIPKVLANGEYIWFSDSVLRQGQDPLAGLCHAIQHDMSSLYEMLFLTRALIALVTKQTSLGMYTLTYEPPRQWQFSSVPLSPLLLPCARSMSIQDLGRGDPRTPIRVHRLEDEMAYTLAIPGDFPTMAEDTLKFVQRQVQRTIPVVLAHLAGEHRRGVARRSLTSAGILFRRETTGDKQFAAVSSSGEAGYSFPFFPPGSDPIMKANGTPAVAVKSSAHLTYLNVGLYDDLLIPVPGEYSDSWIFEPDSESPQSVTTETAMLGLDLLVHFQDVLRCLGSLSWVVPLMGGFETKTEVGGRYGAYFCHSPTPHGDEAFLQEAARLFDHDRNYSHCFYALQRHLPPLAGSEPVVAEVSEGEENEEKRSSRVPFQGLTMAVMLAEQVLKPGYLLSRLHGAAGGGKAEGWLVAIPEKPKPDEHKRLQGLRTFREVVKPHLLDPAARRGESSLSSIKPQRGGVFLL